MEAGIPHQLCVLSTEGHYGELMLKLQPASLGRRWAHFFIWHVVSMMLSLSPVVMTFETGIHTSYGASSMEMSKTWPWAHFWVALLEQDGTRWTQRSLLTPTICNSV